MAERRRVAVTGLGAASVGGVGMDALWNLVLEAAPGPTRTTVPDLDASLYFTRREARRTARFIVLAVAAAAEAWDHAGSPDVDPTTVGVTLGNAFGASDVLHRAALDFAEPRGVVSPTVGLLAASSSGAAAVARHLGVRGVVQVASGACAAGVYGIADGARLIASGEAEVVLAGGVEGPVAASVQQAYAELRVLSRSGFERPFDVRRDGLVWAEGAAVLVLEDLDTARARGAQVLAEVAGWANTNDADALARPSGEGAQQCISAAVARAGLHPEDIVHVNAHGTGTVVNDQTEADAITRVLGRPSVTSVKGSTGHTAGAAGALEAAVVIRSFDERLLPSVGREAEVDPRIDLDLVVGAPRPWSPGPTVDTSFGLGGHNGALVLVPPTD